MRGFSLTQPWASLVALGHKRIETRSWSTSYRGELLIQAAKGFPRDCQELCATEPFLTVLKAAGFTNTRELPTGAIVCVVDLAAVVSTDIIEGRRQILVGVESRFPVEGWEVSNERAFGNYDPNRFGWLTTNVRKLREPIPCKGALGLWSVPQVVLDLIAGQGVL